MNEVLEALWSERIHRLALGIEPLDHALSATVPGTFAADAMHRMRVARAVRVTPDGVPEPLARPQRDPSRPPWEAQTAPAPLARRSTGRFVVLRGSDPPSPIALRLEDPGERFVPRRLALEVPAAPATGRIVRPSLFPGAAYDVPAGAIGLRGRVTRGGAPMRWVRVEARGPVDEEAGDEEPADPGSEPLVGLAHGDAHGEFLLLIGRQAVRGAELRLPLRVRVRVFGPATAPDPAASPAARADPLWDLPLEAVPAGAAGEAVLAGRTLPAGWVSRPNSRRVVEFGMDGLGREGFDFS